MARKNGNGEGSRPRQRADGRWEARYWVGGTMETYHDIARLHLLPALGNKRLKDLTREQVQRMYSQKRDVG